MALEKKIIEFTKNRPPYVEGDVAGFPVHVAEGLIRAGAAIEWSGRATKMYQPPKSKPRKELKEALETD